FQQQARDVRLARVVHLQPVESYRFCYAHREQRIERLSRESLVKVESDVGRKGESRAREVQPARADPVVERTDRAARCYRQHHYFGRWKALGLAQYELDGRSRAGD